MLLMIMPDSFTVGECRMPRIIGIKAQELAASCTAGCHGRGPAEAALREWSQSQRGLDGRGLRLGIHHMDS